MSNKYQPIGWRVLIKVDPVKETTAGGVHLPDDYRQKEGFAKSTGTILAMGDHAFEEYRDAPQPGDRVVFPRYEGTELEEGDLLRLIEDKYIICKLEGEA